MLSLRPLWAFIYGLVLASSWWATIWYYKASGVSLHARPVYIIPAALLALSWPIMTTLLGWWDEED